MERKVLYARTIVIFTLEKWQTRKISLWDEEHATGKHWTETGQRVNKKNYFQSVTNNPHLPSSPTRDEKQDNGY